MLNIRNVTKSYHPAHGPVQALRETSLTVRPGEFVAVQGHSGSGKTTLLLAAGGLLRPDSGRVEIDGSDIYALAPDARARLRARKIGFVFQRYHLIPYLTVMENTLAPTLALPFARAEERAAELIERFGLAHRATHVPGELSAGERQRVALARALLHDPGLLLADEPTGNLDRDNALVVLDHIAEFAGAGGAALMVTHDPEAARRADRILNIENSEPAGPA